MGSATTLLGAILLAGILGAVDVGAASKTRIRGAKSSQRCQKAEISEEWAIQNVPVLDKFAEYTPKCAPSEFRDGKFRRPCYSSCAVVGSSGVLRNSSWGERIDSHSAVFRLNNAPVIGYEEDIGSRTTIRLLHDYHFTSTNYGKLRATEDHGLILLWPPNSRPNTTRTGGPPPRFGPEREFLEVYRARRHSCAPTYRISPEAYGEIYRLTGLLVGKFPPTVPSTGFMAIITALQLCKSVHVFGLSWKSAAMTRRRHNRSGDDTTMTYYFAKKNAIVSTFERESVHDEALYYQTVEKFGITHHDLGTEKQALYSLGQQYNMKFY
eukprot:jgi/Tetstr1/422746/TSEL_013543.t1